MKTIDLILRLAAALVAIGAVIFAIAKYGDKLVAWAKKFCPCSEDCTSVYSTGDAPVEDAPVEEAPVEEPPVEEEVPAVEIPEGEPVAEEADFEA